MNEQTRRAPASYKAFRIVAGVIVIVIAAAGGLVAWNLVPQGLLGSLF